MTALWVFFAVIIGFVLGLLVGRRRDTENAPVTDIDLLRLYEQIRADVLDDIERDKTIEKLKDRLGL